ncbi:MAG TPA: FAD-dependent oxidoreductase [Thermoleophilia bacterium]|nr:FAD-dependent oxidoreductase [Thermoleophilia bacterium]
METSPQRHSLWVATTEMPTYSPLPGDTRAQVLVIGGGMTGLQTAYLLKRAGAEVVLIERHLLGRGVSGHTTAKITALHGLAYHRLEGMFGPDKASVYADANQRALEAMLELIATEAIDCDLMRQAACTYAVTPQEREEVELEAESARAAGLAADVRDDLPLPYETRGGVWLADQAHFHPGHYMKALAELIDGGGCRLHEQTTALSLDDEAMSVTTDRGVVTAEHVVVATHFPVFDHGPLSMRAMARRSYVVAGRASEPPQGMFITVADDHKSLRPQTTADGASYLLMGGEPHRTGEGGDTRARYQALEGWAADTFQPDALEFAWSTQDIWTNDDVPFIGRFRKDIDRVWMATGFKGWGMTHSMVAARIMSEAIQGRSTPWSELYDPWERSLLHGAGKLLSQAAVSIKSLVFEKMVSGDPACTHMGCTTQWNEAEGSWDCPCHGSRFTESGEVLHGPAIEPLKTKPTPTTE